MINSEGTPAIKGVSPGKRLLQGRLQLGLTQEQVAKELYITITKVKALESDDYGRINADTFIRGYIRAYANLLKLDVVEILAAYDQLQQEKDEQLAAIAETKPEPQTAARGNKGAMPFLMIIGALLAGLWLISVWFLDNQQDNNYSALPQASSSVWSSSEAVAESSTAALPAAADSTVAPLVVADASSRSSSVAASATLYSSSRLSSVASSMQASSVAAATASSASVAQSAKSTALDTIVFSFSAECWLEVSDSRGDVLATELQAPGSKLTLVGKAPFDVKLGNAPGVDIQLNGKKVEVIPLLGSNVLTLRVNN
ncbi:MAG TPA: RodZ domain-containing protein [Cellvibrio sp.]|nr:RodZ domain-containing protein [Cellvibrio sp.]